MGEHDLMLELIRASSLEGAARAEAAEHRRTLSQDPGLNTPLVVECIPTELRTSEEWGFAAQHEAERGSLSDFRPQKTTWGLRLAANRDGWFLDVTMNGLLVFSQPPDDFGDLGHRLPRELFSRIKDVGRTCSAVSRKHPAPSYLVRAVLDSEEDVAVADPVKSPSLPAGFHTLELRVGPDELEQGFATLAELVERALRRS